MGIFNIRNRMYGAGYNRVARTLMRSPMYAFMEILNYPLDPQVMIATMDNVRYYKGRFYTFQDFKMEKERGKEQSTIKREWNALKDRTLWSMVDVVDGRKPNCRIAQLDSQVHDRPPRMVGAGGSTSVEKTWLQFPDNARRGRVVNYVKEYDSQNI